MTRLKVAELTPDANRGSPSRVAAGLSSAEAQRRLTEFGPNEIRREQATTPLTLLGRQFASPVIWLLLGASVLSAALGELLDAIAIGAIVIVNAVIGFLQEHRAERAVMALRSMTAPRARVMRDGHSVMIPASAIVPGDVLVLEAGDVAAADARLHAAHALTTNEAPLTGESTPVEKTTAPTGPETPLAERHDFVFMGTSVATGTGLAEVVATGMQTELGRIAHLLATAEENVTPLQRRLARVSQTLLYICGGIVAVVALAGLLRGWPLMQVFMAAVSLAVAAVPEGLPAVVTIALAVGVQRMAARHVLIRRLPAVETLGCATVICTDKTGTLTTGVMRVRELWGRDHTRLLFAAAACCDAEIGRDGQSGIGDPTELAILMAAAERGIHRDDIESTAPRIAEVPFDAAHKRMSIERADGHVYIKGAVESILPISVAGVDDATQANTQMAERGLRVLAVAVAPAGEEERATLLGLIGIADPPRTEAIEAVAAARAAGITTVMITGDHPVTARAIARELGILSSQRDRGRRRPRASDAGGQDPDRARVEGARRGRGDDGRRCQRRPGAARSAHRHRDGPDGHGGDPRSVGHGAGRRQLREHRRRHPRRSRHLRQHSQDARLPAVGQHRRAHGDARGARSAACRCRCCRCTCSGSTSSPTDCPRWRSSWIPRKTTSCSGHRVSPTSRCSAGRSGSFIITTGLLQAAATLGVFVWALNARDLSEARNLAFSVLVFGELFRAFAARSTTRVFWEVGAFTNLRLLAVVVFSVVMQLGIHHMPAAQAVFEIGPLSAADCALTLLVAMAPVTVIEVAKLVRRWHARGAVGAVA